MLDLRWNWNTPYLISPHNPRTLYFGANRVLKSTKRGDEMFPISPDLSMQDSMKIRVSRSATGGITPDNTGAETHATIVSLNESPVRAGILLAGTDDGKVWISWNDGGKWDDLTGRFPGVPAGTYVSRIEPSAHDSLTFFITFDNHRNGDFTPYVQMTTDGGKTFKSIASNLPTGGPDFAHVIRQDRVNPNLLFVGTDVGIYVSVNKGQTWQRFMTGFPTTPVHDLVIHPRDKELVAATHGRGFYIVDVAPLQQLSEQVVASEAHLFAPTTAWQFGDAPVEGQFTAQSYWSVPSAPYGASLVYRLTQRNQGPVRVAILDVNGDTLRTVNGSGAPGLHRVTWNFQGRNPPRRALSVAQRRDSAQQMQRIVFVLDSLEKSAGPRAEIAGRLRTAIQGGRLAQIQVGGGGGGGGLPPAPPDRWVDRPAEQTQQGGGGGGGGGGAAINALNQLLGGGGQGGGGQGGGGQGGGQGGQGAGANTEALQEIAGLFPVPGRAPAGGGGFGGPNFLTALGLGGGGGFGGGGGGGGGGAPTVAPGDYLVSITVGGKTMKQVLRVERAN
jgi:hypothetical protein